MTTQQQLLSSGTIDPLTFGMSRDEATLTLGPSDGHYEHERMTVQKYGQVQLQFDNDNLVQLDWLVDSKFESAFRILDVTFSRKTSVADFLQLCDDAGIAWSIEVKLTYDRQLTIRTCGKVVVIFDLDHRELQKVSVTCE